MSGLTATTKLYFTNIQIDVMRAVLEIARPGLIENSQSDCLFGDLNSDLTINVLDIIITVNIILHIS